jgi:hypothetical protein
VLPDDATVVAELLGPDEELFADLLEQLEGRTQLNLYAAYREGVALREVVATEPEIARLREHTRGLPEDAGYADRVRLGELVSRVMEAKVEDDAAALVDAVADYVAAYTVSLRSGVDELAKVSLLVDRDRQEDLEDHLEALAEAVHERLALRLVGPMAPYDFVRGA